MKDEEMAEEYAAKQNLQNVNPSGIVRCKIAEGFLAGLKAGRPQWHKVADGDLPKDKEYVLVYTNLTNYYVAEKVDNHFMSKGWGFIPMSTVIAWCKLPVTRFRQGVNYV